MPNLPIALLNLARFLDEGGDPNEAAKQLRDLAEPAPAPAPAPSRDPFARIPTATDDPQFGDAA